MITIDFLKPRLRIAEKEWTKAHKKYLLRCKGAKPDSENDQFLIHCAETRMAFLNGQRQLLKELIALETPINSSNNTEVEKK